ncbi:MAG TPA: VIT1/CCC1 transporter family protein [Nitrolancea sp.]|nr:VIT1/CCC1 transporter family protein [Nitrolancea sp.]
MTRFRANLQAEIDGATLYRALAELEETPEVAAVYREMAEDEERHAQLWRERLEGLGTRVADPPPTWRTRLLVRLARWFGPALVLPTVATHERSDSLRYRVQDDAVKAGLSEQERTHARALQRLTEIAPSGVVGTTLARIETRHRGAGGNALRAAVLGANDGLVSNTSLVMGVAGADLAARNILITGIAGLLAGSLSMALGEWLSVQSARELYAHQIELEREELEAFPDDERRELVLIYRSKGVPAETAEELASQLIRDPEAALETLAREELGIDPHELGGSAWVAAITSFVLFSIGAIIPVFPYLFMAGMPALVTSIALSMLALFAIGAGITLITGRSPLTSGFRQVLFGVAAAAITFGIGWLIGTAVAG